jgi:hypothetical protein
MRYLETRGEIINEQNWPKKSQEQIPSSTPWMRIDRCQSPIGNHSSCSPTTEPSIVAEGAFDFNGPPNLNKTSGQGPTE